MRYRNIDRIRLMCGIYGIDSEVISERFAYKDMPYSEESMDILLGAMDEVVSMELADTQWIEYFVPMEDAWFCYEDLPAICKPS